MKLLKDTLVRRYGATAGWNRRFEDTEVTVGVAPINHKPRRLILNTSIRSKGGGKTVINIEVGPQDFPKVLEQMTEADSEGCLNSMLEEIKRREILLKKRAQEDGYEHALDELESTARSEVRKYFDAFKKKATKLRSKKFEDAFDLERGIERIVEKLRITDYDISRRHRRHLTFWK